MPLAPRSTTRIVTLALAVGCADAAGPDGDRAAPSVRGVVLAHDGSTLVLPAAQAYRAGDPVWLLLDVLDDHRVGWIGFHVSGPIDAADSVAVPDSLPRLRVLVGVHLGSLSGLAQVRGFAVDGAGNRTETVAAGSPVSLYAPVVRPLLAAPLPGPATHVAHDLKREQLLLAEPGRSRIAVFSLIAHGFGPAIAAPRPPGAMDFTASGDSLVVLFAETGELGILPLVGPAPAWRVVPLPLSAPAQSGSGALRVSAANRVVVAAGAVVEYDIPAARARLRPDAGAAGLVPPTATLGRTGDRRTLVLAWAEGGDAAVGQTYDSDAAAFADPRPLGPLAALGVATDAAGRFLVGASLFETTLEPVRRFYPPGQGRVGALAALGGYAYFGLGSGYLRTRVADGVTLEQVVLPEPPAHLVVLPGTPERVVAVGAEQVTIVTDEAAGSATARPGAPAPSARPEVSFSACFWSSTTTIPSPTTWSSTSGSWASSPWCTATTP